MRNLIYGALITSVVMLAGAFPAAAQTVLYDKSKVSCISKQENVPVEGPFKKFTAQLTFDPAKPEAGKAQIEIDVGSYDIGNGEVNDMAKEKDWFNVKAFPKATFVSTSIRALGGGKFEARGPLTIKGKTLDAVVPFTYAAQAGGGVFDGAFNIKRLQYNIGEGPWKNTDTVADDVQIKFHLVTASAPAKK